MLRFPSFALRADHVNVKVCVGSGTAWDVSVLWCPGLRRPPLPFSRSASGPLIPPPGTLASVPASQAQFYFPLPQFLFHWSPPPNKLSLLRWCATKWLFVFRFRFAVKCFQSVDENCGYICSIYLTVTHWCTVATWCCLYSEVLLWCLQCK